MTKPFQLSSRSRVLVAGVIGLVALGTVWDLSVRIFDIKGFILQPPGAIIQTFIDDPGAYLSAAVVTGRNTLAGLAISLVLSLAISAVFVVSRFLEDAGQPLLMIILVTPWVAYLPIVIIAFGGGWPPVIFLVSLVTLPAFVFAMVSGLRSTDPAALELFALVNASRFEVYWRLRLPSALPTILASARYNAGLALGAAYFADTANLSTDGLGYLGATAFAYSDGPRLWTTIVTIALLGVLFVSAITLIEQAALRWHVSQRS